MLLTDGDELRSVKKALLKRKGKSVQHLPMQHCKNYVNCN